MKNKPEVKVTMKFAKKPVSVKTVETVKTEAVEVKEQPVVSAVEEEPQPVVRSRLRLPNISRYWLVLGAGIGLLGLAVLFGIFWNANPLNQGLGVLTIGLAIGSVALCWRQFKHRQDIIGRNAAVNTGQAPIVATEQVGNNGFTPNSLNIYAAHDEDIGAVVPRCIVFENVYKPLGQPQHCLNTNKDYYIHIWDIAKQRLVPFVLPDRKYTDPSILARYLGLPAQRKYLRNRESLMKLIGPGLLAVGVIIGFITIIALSG